jgi:hypothetical protein
MKKYIYLIFCFYSTSMSSQFSDYAGVLSHEKYFENPRKYLSKLDSTLINEEILIDRFIYGDKILNINGLNHVTTLNYSDFYQIYQELKYANKDTTSLSDFSNFLNTSI